MSARKHWASRSIALKAQPRSMCLGAMRTGAILLFCAMAACQQAVSTAATSQPSPQGAAQTAPTLATPPDASASGITLWKLSVSPGESGTYRIHVVGTDGRELQVLEGPEGNPPYDAAALLRLEDFTGDGKLDILARGASAGASAFASESIYVYDTESNRFLDAEPFEDDGEITKTRLGCIAVEHRDPNNMTYSKDQYCWEGKWVLERR